ncbi:MAG: exopolysaccharide biosynthesis polyprenyl glycosylphosphotransferase [Acidimicrobiales bacterium]
MITTDALSIVSAILLFGIGLVPAATTAAGFVFLAGMAGLYRSRLDPSILNDLMALVGRLLIASAVTYSLSGNGTGTVAALGDGLGRIWWQSIVVAVVALIATRALMYSLVRSARRRGWVNHRTLIVGAGPIGSRLAEDLLAHPEYGLRPVAFHDRFPTDRSHPLPPIYTGTLDESIEQARASTVVFAPVALPDSVLIDLIQSRHRDKVEFYFVPRLHAVNSAAGREIERVRSLPLVRLRRAAHRSVMWKTKAIGDRLLAAIALLLLAPVLVILAVAVALLVGRPILFSQRRVGLDGRHFSILKFRSLPDAPTDESDTAWAAETSRRPTTFGRLLRQSSLDELPQLWNILRGDMSFVGPRPERPHFVGTFSQTYTHYDSRHRVKSGLTGLAQVNGLRGDTSISERAEFDNIYVETWSLGEDMKIMIRTFGSIVKRGGR